MRRIVKYCSRLIGAIAVCLVAALTPSCSDSDPAPFGTTPHGTISIAHLKTLCREGSTTITDDISIEGYVVANDLFDEYQQAIIVCDESAGIEIAIECNSTATRFPISARVVVHCTGLALGNSGRIVLGAAPTSSYTVDRIAKSDIERYIFIDRSQPKEIEPRKMTIEQINTDCVGNYIALDDVSFGNEAGRTWCDHDPESGEWITTSRSISDRRGNTLKVRTIAECSYRAEMIPSGYGSVWGIVEYLNKEYSLRIINHRVEFGQ